MLEIIILIRLCSNIGRRVEAKGYKGGRFKLLLVAAWFAGELAGAIGGTLVHLVLWGADDEFSLLTYLFALTGAALGAVIAFTIASSLPPKEPETPVE